VWSERGFVARVALPRIVLGLGAGLSIPFLGLYFQDRFGLSPASVGQLQAAAQLFMSAGFLCAPAVERRLGPVGGMCALQAASMPFFVCLAFTGSLTMAAAAFLLRAGLMNAATPIYKSFLMREARPELREMANGIDNLAWGISWVAGPHVGGAILDASRDSYATLMLVTVGLYALSAAATAWLLGPLARRAAPAPPAGHAPEPLARPERLMQTEET
jgi:MFS family permease